MSTGQFLQSTLNEDGKVTLSLNTANVPEPAEGEVVVRMEAAPINPSDLGVMFAAADITQAESSGEGIEKTLSASMPKAWLPRFKARIGQALPLGNEGAGTVVAAGSSP